MPERNRVTPYGEIVRSALRGAWMGNRGCIHRDREIVRAWNSRHWIACALEFKGWVAPKWVPGRWTALFFYDEAVALAAGHRPCAFCRREDYNAYRSAAELRGAAEIDARLHAERLDGRAKRIHKLPWSELPAGTFVEMRGTAHVVLDDGLRPWSAQSGYGSDVARPSRGDACVLTPPTSVRAIERGYRVHIARNSR